MSDHTQPVPAGPDNYWSTQHPPSRGQLAAIATDCLDLLGVAFPANRLEATATIVRLKQAIADGKTYELPHQPF